MPQRFDNFFHAVTGNEGDLCHYSTRLDTYGCGCQHNCGYCYARSLLDFRGLWNPVAPSAASVRDIYKVVKNKLRPGDVVRLGGMTDCFQPMEAARKNTRRTIEMLNARRVHYLIVTKGALVAQYTDVLRPDLAHIQISITSTDAAISRKVEPGASLPEERIAAVEALAAAGYDTAVRLSPYLPAFVDMARINAIRCDKVLVEFLRVNTWIERWLGNLAPSVSLAEWTHYHGGYRHLPLARKRELLAAVTGFREVSVCEDVPEHWEYWRTRVNANPEDCCNLKFK